jgi:DNA-binding NarL/FixJ family response regulator
LFVPISVLIADDHAAFRARAREMLGSASNHVVARAADAADPGPPVVALVSALKAVDDASLIGRAP